MIVISLKKMVIKIVILNKILLRMEVGNQDRQNKITLFKNNARNV